VDYAVYKAASVYIRHAGRPEEFYNKNFKIKISEATGCEHMVKYKFAGYVYSPKMIIVSTLSI
jgi:hypothetical protein